MTFVRKSRTDEYLRLLLGLMGTLLLSALAVLSVRGAWNMYGKLSAAWEASDAAKRQLSALEVRQVSVQADIERLSTSRGVEGELRERYGFARPGEGVIQVVEKDDAPVPAGTPSQGGFGAALKALIPW